MSSAPAVTRIEADVLRISPEHSPKPTGLSQPATFAPRHIGSPDEQLAQMLDDVIAFDGLGVIVD